MNAEQERVQVIMQSVNEGDRVGEVFVYDERTKRFRAAQNNEDPDHTTAVTQEDLGMFVTDRGYTR